MSEVERAVRGVQGIVHLGGFSVEGPWETILNANIIGCYNLFEAARRAGVERVVFASSNHAVGFYPRQRKIGIDGPVRPDSRYGVSKAFGEALGALYAYKHGLRVTCLRIGNVTDTPADKRRLSIWLSPEDLRAADPHRARASGHPPRDFLRRLRQCARVLGQRGGVSLRLPPAGRAEDHAAAALAADAKLRAAIRSATGIRAAPIAATSSTAASSARRPDAALKPGVPAAMVRAA